MKNKPGKLGLIAFANNGGIGIQTKRLYDMLKPDKVLVVDTTSISKNKKLNLNWYKNKTVVSWPIRNSDIVSWTQGLDSVFMVENPYNFYIIHYCRQHNIKTICQTNYEFCENIFAPYLPTPDLFVMPSHWYLEEMQTKFNAMYLPPPIDEKLFYHVRTMNMMRNEKPRFLHMVGTLAHKDRNGTLDLIESIKHCKEDFDLVIHTQHPLPDHYQSNDSRIIIRQKDFKSTSQIYEDFDAMILPRRYGGLSLSTNEALTSGLPVMMTNISPNDQILPKQWLVPTSGYEEIQIRDTIRCYKTDPEVLAKKIDSWAKNLPPKKLAVRLSRRFSVNNLKPIYDKIVR